MPIHSPLPIIPVVGILKSMGFETSGDALGTLKFDFGNLVLVALPCANQFLRPAVMFSGHYSDQRIVAEISFEMPDKVESELQAKAWLAYGIGESFHPKRPCAWLQEGKLAQEFLPWEREMRAYKDRPFVWVPRDWIRLAAKELRHAAELAPERQLCGIKFDGRILTIDLGRRAIPLPAEGAKPWEHSFKMRVKQLAGLPRRWVRDPVPIGVWNDQIEFGSFVFDLHHCESGDCDAR